MSAPSDPGLQPERTELAWQRTALSIAVGSLVAARVLPAVFGHLWWALPGVAGAVFAGVVWVLSRRRHVAHLAALRERTPTPGAGLLLAVAVLAVCAGATGFALLLI